jgi:hypothetical protein
MCPANVMMVSEEVAVKVTTTTHIMCKDVADIAPQVTMSTS